MAILLRIFGAHFSRQADNFKYDVCNFAYTASFSTGLVCSCSIFSSIGWEWRGRFNVHVALCDIEYAFDNAHVRLLADALNARNNISSIDSSHCPIMLFSPIATCFIANEFKGV